MNAYFACVVMRQTVGRSAARGVREERIVPVHARDDEEAARKAEAFARSTEYDSVNCRGGWHALTAAAEAPIVRRSGPAAG